jgi:hypothetical protein
MPPDVLPGQIEDIVNQLSANGGGFSNMLETTRAWITDTFGQTGLWVALLVGTVIVLMTASKLISVLLSVLKFFVLPTAALTILATIFLGVSFVVALPASATVCSLFLLFKG